MAFFDDFIFANQKKENSLKMTNPLEPVKKSLTINNAVMALMIMLVVFFILAYVVKLKVITYAADGTIANEGEIKPAFRMKKKTV